MKKAARNICIGGAAALGLLAFGDSRPKGAAGGITRVIDLTGDPADFSGGGYIESIPVVADTFDIRTSEDVEMLWGRTLGFQSGDKTHLNAYRLDSAALAQAGVAPPAEAGSYADWQARLDLSDLGLRAVVIHESQHLKNAEAFRAALGKITPSEYARLLKLDEISANLAEALEYLAEYRGKRDGAVFPSKFAFLARAMAKGLLSPGLESDSDRAFLVNQTASMWEEKFQIGYADRHTARLSKYLSRGNLPADSAEPTAAYAEAVEKFFAIGGISFGGFLKHGVKMNQTEFELVARSGKGMEMPADSASRVSVLPVGAGQRRKRHTAVPGGRTEPNAYALIRRRASAEK